MTENTKCIPLWFSDGNLIIRADDQRFRVHRGVIERHSDEMVSNLMSGHTPGEVEEGVQVARAAGAGAHWQILLEVLYCYNANVPLGCETTRVDRHDLERCGERLKLKPAERVQGRDETTWPIDRQVPPPTE